MKCAGPAHCIYNPQSALGIRRAVSVTTAVESDVSGARCRWVVMQDGALHDLYMYASAPAVNAGYLICLSVYLFETSAHHRTCWRTEYFTPIGYIHYKRYFLQLAHSPIPRSALSQILAPSQPPRRPGRRCGLRHHPYAVRQPILSFSGFDLKCRWWCT
jgi:hypothetical protein